MTAVDDIADIDPGEAAMSTAEVITLGCYADAARTYLDAGWNPIPVDPTGNRKQGIPSGFTGYKGRAVTAADVTQWVTSKPDHLVGLRMPPGVIGIDVDQYDDKHGADQLQLLETELGLLPPTWASTSRPGSRSGIYFYRIPVGVRFPTGPCPDVEFIQPHHRYAVVWPSVHRAGRQYQWYDDTGEPADRTPGIDELADLPWSWIEHFQRAHGGDAGDVATTEQVAAFIDRHTEATFPGALKGITTRLNGWEGSRHDTLIKMSCWAMREAAAGLYTATDAHDALIQWWKLVMKKEPKRLPDINPEFGDAIAWAVGQADADPDRVAKIRADHDARHDNLTFELPPNIDLATGLDTTTPKISAPMAGVDGFRYTDAGNAERLLHRHGDQVRFVPLWRRWLAYDGTRWRLDHADTLVAHLAAEIGPQLVQHVPEVYGEPSKLNPLLAAVRRAESAAGVHATLTMAASKPGVAIDHEALDADPWLLNVANATIDLRTGNRRPHDGDDLLTMIANADHDPSATAPCWERFLEQILPDEQVRRFVQRLCGLALVGTQLEHVLVICLGGGANGKSTMTRVVADVLGDYAIVAARDVLLALKHDAHPTAKADLFRRRFAHSGELPPAAKLDEAQVKELTGGDRIKARRMREDHWEFDPSHLLWLHANHRPMIEGTDDGIWRRVLLIPFNVQIPTDQRDPHLARRIVDTESAGVLRWMLDGLADYLEHDLQVPEIVRAATDGYRTDSDTVSRFLAESDLVIAPSMTLDAAELIVVHQDWHRASGSTESEGAHYQRVIAALRERGATNKKNKSRGRYWIGLGATQ